MIYIYIKCIEYNVYLYSYKSIFDIKYRCRSTLPYRQTPPHLAQPSLYIHLKGWEKIRTHCPAKATRARMSPASE